VWSSDALPASVFRVLAGDPTVADQIDSNVMIAAPHSMRPGLDGVVALIPDGSRYEPEVLAGHLPRTGHPDEVSLSDRDAAELGVKVGDHVPFDGVALANIGDCISAGTTSCTFSPLGDAVVVGITRTLQDIGPRSSSLLLMARPDFLNADPAI